MIHFSVRVVFAVLAGAMVLIAASLVPGTIFGGPGYRGLGGLGAAPPSQEGTTGQPLEATPGGPAQEPVLDLSDEDMPAEALAAYQRAADIMARIKPTCGLSWTVLAAIGRVESDHGRSPAEMLSDRSVGPMKIRPNTWNEVGVDGDGDGTRSVEDLDDAALAVAVYLCAGSENLRIQTQLESALRRWNVSDAFLTAVLTFEELYSEGRFEIIAEDKSRVLAAGLLYGPSLTASPLNTNALRLSESPRLLPPRVLARVTAEAAEAVESAAAGGPLSTETEAVPLPTTEVSPSEVQSFVAGAPVGKPPSETTPTEQPVELPAELPEELAPEPPAPQPSGPTDVPGALDPTPSEPAPTTPGPTAPSGPSPSEPSPSAPSPSAPSPSAPSPSDSGTTDPTPSEPPPPEPTASEPAPSSEPPAPEPTASEPAPSSEPPAPEPTASTEPPPPDTTASSEPAPSDTTSADPAPSDSASTSTDSVSPSAG